MESTLSTSDTQDGHAQKSAPSGTFALRRGALEHPALDGGEYCRRAAFVYLIEEAGWRARTRNIQGRTIRLKRGQLTASTRFLAKAWGWSEASVRRFLRRLETDALIVVSDDAGQNVISICDYDVFQLTPGFDDADTGGACDAESTQERRSGDAAATQTRIPVTPGMPVIPEIHSDSALRAGVIPPAQSGVDGEILPPQTEPPNPRKRAFDEGIALLVEAGKTEAAARAFFGKLLRKGDGWPEDAVLDALAAARQQKPIDPIPWLIAALEARGHRHRKHKPGSPMDILGGRV